MLFWIGGVSSGESLYCSSIPAFWVGRNRRGGMVEGIFRTLE
jgi:hypothetical protein